jgi:flavin reductase (DIM6/NTAB) family NADH-FMN oxidoreductase RutF
MKTFNKEELAGMDRSMRINLFNSITGIKPANLVGTISAAGQTNLAIFSSVFHMGSDPALIGMILRPHREVRRDSYENMKETGQYTINHVPLHSIESAHKTSSRFEKEISEFLECGFTEDYIEGFKAPFVKESRIRFGLSLVEEIPVKHNQTTILIGQIENIVIEAALLDETGRLDLEEAQTAGVSGLDSYYQLVKKTTFL